MECIIQVISDLITVYGIAFLFKVIEIGVNLFGG